MVLGTGVADFRFIERPDGADEHLRGVFVVGYKITDDNGSDAWSERFSRFKAKNERALYGAAEMLNTAFRTLLKVTALPPDQVLIIPALASGETHAQQDSAIARLTQYLASSSKSSYDLKVLTKKVHSPIHGKNNASDRDAELDKAAYSAKAVVASTVLILDDFVTRGSTMSRIAAAIHEKSPDVNVYGLALAKTERRSWLPTISNEFVPKAMDDAWQAGEKYYKDNVRK